MGRSGNKPVDSYNHKQGIKNFLLRSLQDIFRTKKTNNIFFTILHECFRNLKCKLLRHSKSILIF